MSIASKNINISSADVSFYTTLAAAIAAGIAGAGLTPLQQETTLTEGEDTISVSINGGVLPVSDGAVLLFWENGIVSQTDFVINRGVDPDTIVLNDPIEAGQTVVFTLLIFA